MRIRSGATFAGPAIAASGGSGAALAQLAARCAAVEIDHTFFRSPDAGAVAAWYRDTPDDFRIAVAASRRVTHEQRLRSSAGQLAYLHRLAAILKHKLGAVVFQLPPSLRRDEPLLRDFLALLPEGFPAALDFRHASWFTDSVLRLLDERSATVCWTDPGPDGGGWFPHARWGYVRLRRPSYDELELDRWAQRLTAQSWREALVFFKTAAHAPELAVALQRRCAAR